MNSKRRLLLTIFFSILFLTTGATAFAQGLVPCDGSAANQCTFEKLITLIQNVLNFLIYDIATPIAAIMFAVAGYFYLTAGDNEAKVKRAHDIFVSVMWGFGIMLIAWALVNFIFNLLTGGTFSLLG